MNGSVFALLDKIAPAEGINFDFDYSFRKYRGLSNTSGSAYSVIFALGSLASLYLNMNYPKWIYKIAIIPMFLAAALNGRTGVIMILLCLMLYLFYIIKKGKIMGAVVVAVGMLFLAPILVSDFFLTSSRGTEMLNWYSEAFGVFSNDGNSFAESFEKNHIFFPRKTTAIFFGAGFDPDDYINGMGSDSGVIKNIFAFGLILTLLFYGHLVYKLYRSGQETNNHNNNEVFLSFSLILILLLGELKEPFLVKTFLSRMIFIVIIYRNFEKNKFFCY